MQGSDRGVSFAPERLTRISFFGGLIYSLALLYSTAKKEVYSEERGHGFNSHHRLKLCYNPKLWQKKAQEEYSTCSVVFANIKIT